MKNLSSLQLVIFGLILSSNASAQTKLDELRQAIPQTLQHPYLHFRPEAVSILRERVRSDARAKEVYQRLLKECDRVLDLPVRWDVPPRYRGVSPYFEPVDPFHRYRDELSKNAFDLAFVYQVTGDEKYARKSYEFADALSSMDSWSSTWDDFRWLYWMGKPWGAKWNEEEDNEIVYLYDLGPASASRHLAAAYDWIYSTLTDYQRKRLRSGLLENAVLRVRGNYDYHWWAHAWRTNWLPVCFSGVGLAALAMCREDPQLLDVVEEVRFRINRYFDESIDVDGGYQEGVGYWSYGMENAVLYAAALKNVSGGKVDMFQNPRLKMTIQFPLYTYVPPHGAVNFEDAHDDLEGNYALFNRLAHEYKSREAKFLAEFFRPFDATSRPGDFDIYSLIWPEPDVKPSVPDASSPMSIHFRGIDWLVMRASWESEDFPLLAAKGGIHDDPHHGHLDAGQFAIAYRGEWPIRELGYMQPSGFGYWDYRRRFKEYVHANALGHNVVFVNGEQQEYGPRYFGKVTAFQTTPEEDYAVIDASKAYPGEALKGWRRAIVFKKPQLFILVDEVECAPGAEIAVRFHPGVAFDLKEGYTLLRGKKGTMAMLSLLPLRPIVREDRHAFLPEKREARFEPIPYYDLVVRAPGSKTHIVNILVPIDNEQEGRMILQTSEARVQDGKLECNVTYRDRRYSASFDISGHLTRRE